MHEMILSEESREATRIQALANHSDQDLWVFAYGSLMWDPAIQFSEVRRAKVDGFSRHFILKDTFGARGSEEQPGLMAALDHGAGCEGLLFRISADRLEEETKILWQREMVAPAYLPEFVSATASGQEIQALTFVADHSADVIHPDLTRAQQVAYIATGAGFLGTSLDYLTGIAQHFETLCIHDADISALVEETNQYLSSLNRSGSVND